MIHPHVIASVGETKNVFNKAEDVDKEYCSGNKDSDFQCDNEDSFFDLDD